MTEQNEIDSPTPDQSSEGQLGQDEGQQPKRKWYLTEEQARIVNIMRSYEKAYVRVSSLSGNWLILNGDETERVYKSTMKALIGKGHLMEMGVGRWKLAE